MEIKHANSTSIYGPGVEINLTSSELVTAIESYLTAHNVYIHGARTTYVNESMCESARVYIDPSGFVMKNGVRYSGRGHIDK